MLVFSKTVYINLSISQFTSQFLSCFQWESWRAPAVPIYSYAWICTYRNATDAGFMDCHRDLFLGEILLLLLAQHFPFFCVCFCHFQYIQLQQQEMNEFTEDERRNLEVTVCEMENEVCTIWIHFLVQNHWPTSVLALYRKVLSFFCLQLKLTKQERTQINASLRRKSERYDELVQEVKQSR